MVILGIESSCDETGIGILKNKKILANTVATQEDLHSVYGGIVPELASRAHCSKIDNLFINLALKKSGLKQKNIDFIGVTSEPGLKGSLLVGVSFAAGLGYSLGIPVYKINHLYAHIAVNFLTPGVKFPALGLVISGGHTSFFYIRDYTNFTLIGKTLDDACGETFDKAGRMLQLGFPGGPAIEREAKKSNEKIKFPVALISKSSIDFSFSGLKTSVMYYIKKNGLNNVPDICAGFQKAITDALVKKTERAIKKYPVKTFFLGGGVAQNQYIVAKFKLLFNEKKIKFFVPPKKLCLDNGAMVAIMTYFLIAGKIKKPPQPLRIEVQPTKSMY